MTLKEIAEGYRESDALLTGRISQLRAQAKVETDDEVLWNLNRRIYELSKMRTEVRVIAELCERYYEKGYYRSEKYTIQW